MHSDPGVQARGKLKQTQPQPCEAPSRRKGYYRHLRQNVARATRGWGSLGKAGSISDGMQGDVMSMLACESPVGCAGWWRTAGASPAGGTDSVMGLWLEVRQDWTGRRWSRRARGRDLSRQAAGPQLHSPEPSGTSSCAGHQQSRRSCHCTSWLRDSSTQKCQLPGTRARSHCPH